MNAILRKALGGSIALILVLAGGAAAIAQRPDRPPEGGPPPGLGGAPPVAAPLTTARDGAVVRPNDRPRRIRLNDEERNQAILSLLDQRLTMSFPQETPLEDVLKYIKSNTESKELGLPAGIPIYVDPRSLQEAEKTRQMPVTLDLEGIPLRRTLSLLLRQLDLTYYVVDGLLIITPEDSEDLGLFEPAPVGPSPMKTMLRKAERGEMNAEERKEFLQQIKDLKEIRKAYREIEAIENGADSSGEGGPKPAAPAPPSARGGFR